MKAIGAIGLAVAIGGLFIGAKMEGSNPLAVLNLPAMLIVLGGTMGAVMLGTTMAAIAAIPKLYQKALLGVEFDMNGRVAELVGFAEKARRDGLLALDDSVKEIEDDFTRKGLQLVVDGTDPDLVADVLEAEIDNMGKRHDAMRDPFEKAGGYAPTMGIIGTVFGLINVLQNLDAPETLGPMISAAFIATLMGVASANVVFLPVAAKLKTISKAEKQFRQMTLEGILSIQAGDNPRVLAEKLITFVPPKQRPAEASDIGKAPADAVKQAA